MTHDPTLVQLLDVARATFRAQREISERAMAQLDDADFFRTIDEESNSVALIAKHVGGNLRSRWSEFLTSDGEKPDRDRDSEFVLGATPSRAAVMDTWTVGWTTLERTLGALSAADLGATVHIRGEGMTALAALHRSLAHIANHAGQIVFLAKHLRGAAWRTLSIPRGKSAEYAPTRPRQAP
jgi:hypothetical protein